MAAELDAEGEKRTEPAPPQYDPKEKFQLVLDEALAFEKDLDALVNPWIALGKRLVTSRLWFAVAAFVVTVALGIAAFMQLEQPFRPAIVIIASPLAWAAWTGILMIAARTEGIGVRGSEGMAHTVSELKNVLQTMYASLKSDQKACEKGIVHYSNHLAAEDLIELCNVRIRGLFVHQRALRRVGLLNDECKALLGNARSLAIICPLAIIVLAGATFAFPFFFAEKIAPWATTDLLMRAAVLVVAGLVVSFLPFVLAFKFVRMVQRRLSEAIEKYWDVKPFEFDSTGPITEEFRRISAGWEKCKQMREQMNSNANHSFAPRPQGGKLALPAPAEEDKGPAGA
ncbi:MAG: hypothetical protein ACLFV8_00130 [Alphaproteobacteria bacterium]